MATTKTGAEHLASLRDGRQVFLDGELVADVTEHQAFRNAVWSAALLYDYQADPANVERMTVQAKNGRRINRSWQIPANHAEMVERRHAMTSWAELTAGYMGRSPDHVASALVGQVIGIDTLRQHEERGAQALLDYFEYAAAEDLFLTYTIINPQVDRSKAWGDQPDEDLVAGVVDEDTTGITVRGAKMLGTSSIMANELFVANLQPLKPGEEKYAISFAVPMNVPGLKVLSRKSYEAAAVSEFDNPLSCRFDENDALVYFDDVKVPWDRVFVDRDVNMARAQFHDTFGHIYQNYQAQVRLAVKARFLAGVARRLADVIGTSSIPAVAERLGHLAAQAAGVEAMLNGIEVAGSQVGGAYVPNKHFVYSAQVLTQELYPQLVATIRELAGGSLIMLPSSVADFDAPDLARIIAKTQLSPAMEPDERVRFLKLAWDAVGSEFASRHVQYEMFYAGAQFVTRGHSFRTYNWEAATGIIDTVRHSETAPSAT
ncbi:MAG: 4-hydroxyphenylacetate 3-monooxygenase [Streptosporangiales bacterium]|nr:4-hydroxyphenylacetate 3-monooxygenase [Streptosporangiales bacterium]